MLSNLITMVVCVGLTVVGAYLVLVAYPLADTAFPNVIGEVFVSFFGALFGVADSAKTSIPVFVAAILVIVCIPTAATAVYRLVSSLSRTYFDPTRRVVIQGSTKFSFDDFGGFESTRHWTGIRVNFIPIMIPIGVKLCITILAGADRQYAYEPELKIRLYGPLMPTGLASRKLREEIASVMDPDGSLLARQGQQGC